jgi:hypothetical protein
MHTTAETVTPETPPPTARPTAVTNEEVWDFVTNPNSRGNHECDEDCTERITEHRGLEVTHECAPWELPGEVLAWFKPEWHSDYQLRVYDGQYLIDEGDLINPITRTHQMRGNKELGEFLFAAYRHKQKRLTEALRCLALVPSDVRSQYKAIMQGDD